MKKYFILLFALIIPNTAPAQDTPINIGAMLHLTGEYSMEGQAFLEGINLRVKEINQNGGVGGRKINVITEDSAYDAKNTVTIANKFISPGNDIKGVLVSTLHEVKASAPIFERFGMPAIVLWDATPEIEKMGESIFAIGPWAPDTGEKASRFATKKLVAKTAVVISNQHDWGLSVSEAFKQDFENSGGKILSHEILNPDMSDFRTILVKVRARRPDVIYAPLNYSLISFAKQTKQLKVEIPIIMADNITQAVLDISGGSFDGIYHTSVADPDNEEAEKLRASYLAEYKREPKLLLFTAWAYDGVRILEEALKNSNNELPSIRDSIYKIKNLKGASGMISFNEAGSSPMFISMFQIRDSRLVRVEGPDR